MKKKYKLFILLSTGCLMQAYQITVVNKTGREYAIVPTYTIQTLTSSQNPGPWKLSPFVRYTDDIENDCLAAVTVTEKLKEKDLAAVSIFEKREPLTSTMQLEQKNETTCRDVLIEVSIVPDILGRDMLYLFEKSR